MPCQSFHASDLKMVQNSVNKYINEEFVAKEEIVGIREKQEYELMLGFRKIKGINIEEFYKDLMFNIDEDEINNISNKEFKRKYREKAFSWRGRKIIERNLNILKDKSSDQ
jgi:hypothetical protein